MKPKLFLFIMLAFVINANAQSPGWAWDNSNGGTDYEWGQSLATDAAGNTVVVGAFYSPTITFGSTVLTNPNAGKHTSYIVKYDDSGNVTWAKQPIAVGGWNFNRATGVGIDVLNNIYVTGVYYSTTLTFGTITLTNNSCCLGAFYLAKYDASGNIVWAITTSGVQAGGGSYPPQPNYEVTPLNKMAINKNNGDLYIVGTFDSLNMTFGSTVLTNATIDTGYYPLHDIFIAKYNSSGNFIWAKSIGGERQDYATDIAVNNSSVFVTGAFSSLFLIVGSAVLVNPNQNGSWDNYEPFVAKYDASGNVVWAKQGNATVTGIKQDKGKNIAADASGNCYLTGEFESPFIVFDNDTLFNTDTVSGSSKIFVVKYNSSGNVNWTKNFASGIGNDFAQGIQTDGNGNVYVGGTSYAYTMTFDSITLATLGYGIYITKLNPSGNVYWAKILRGNNQLKHLVGLTINAAGNVYVTGGFNGSIYFGTDTLTSNGLSDIFTAKLLNCSSGFSLYPTSIPHDWLAVNQASGIPPITYSWDWGDGSATSSGPAPSHTYNTPGYYNICLTITDGAGCSQTYCDSSTYLYRSDGSNTVININVHVLGVQQQSNDGHNFSVYPNPTSSTFTLTINDRLIKPQIKIYNVMGALVYQEEIKNTTTNFSKQITLHEPAGIYLLKVFNGENYYCKKLIIE